MYVIFFVFCFFFSWERCTLIVFVFWQLGKFFIYAHDFYTLTRLKTTYFLFFVFLTLNVFLLYLFGTISHYFCESVVSDSPVIWSSRNE